MLSLKMDRSKIQDFTKQAGESAGAHERALIVEGISQDKTVEIVQKFNQIRHVQHYFGCGYNSRTEKGCAKLVVEGVKCEWCQTQTEKSYKYQSQS